jgi:hypothetical protein
MSICNESNPITSCNGQSIKPSDLRLNVRKVKMSSSSHIDEKKALSVLGASGEYISLNGPCRSDVGLVGDITPSVTKCCYKSGFMGRIQGRGTGVDKKHASYDRYLARKKGLNIIQQNCE